MQPRLLYTAALSLVTLVAVPAAAFAAGGIVVPPGPTGKNNNTNYQKMAAAYPQALISQRTLFQLEGDYVQALESAWQSALSIRGFGLLDGLSTPSGSSGAGSARQAGNVSSGAPAGMGSVQ